MNKFRAECDNCNYKSAIVDTANKANAAAVNHQLQTTHNLRINSNPEVPFSPFVLAEKLGGVTRSGINWTWVEFPDEETRKQFDTECRKNGYRVRDYGPCKTQYHHYQD